MAAIITPTIPQDLIDFLHTYRIFLIAGHKEPDGDCIGSSVALSLFFTAAWKGNRIAVGRTFSEAGDTGV